MLTILALLGALGAAQTPAAAPGVVIPSAELQSTLKAAIENKTIDTLVREVPVLGGKAKVAMLHRERAETNALIHDEVTEIYQILEGSGTLVTGGTLENARVSDLTRVGAGMSQTGVHQGGGSQRVGPGDVIIVPAGTPHRLSQLDGPISYLVYRFEPSAR